MLASIARMVEGACGSLVEKKLEVRIRSIFGRGDLGICPAVTQPESARSRRKGAQLEDSVPITAGPREGLELTFDQSGAQTRASDPVGVDEVPLPSDSPDSFPADDRPLESAPRFAGGGVAEQGQDQMTRVALRLRTEWVLPSYLLPLPFASDKEFEGAFELSREGLSASRRFSNRDGWRSSEMNARLPDWSNERTDRNRINSAIFRRSAMLTWVSPPRLTAPEESEIGWHAGLPHRRSVKKVPPRLAVGPAVPVAALGAQRSCPDQSRGGVVWQLLAGSSPRSPRSGGSPGNARELGVRPSWCVSGRFVSAWPWERNPNRPKRKCSEVSGPRAGRENEAERPDTFGVKAAGQRRHERNCGEVDRDRGGGTRRMHARLEANCYPRSPM